MERVPGGVVVSRQTLIRAPHSLRIVRSHPISAHWVYRCCDPHAVVLWIRTLPVVTEWALDRELLLRGLHRARPVGDGDVALRSVRQRWLRIDLRSPHGEARLLADWQTAADFLHRAYEAVPHQSRRESALSSRQVDTAIARCLEDA